MNQIKLTCLSFPEGSVFLQIQPRVFISSTFTTVPSPEGAIASLLPFNVYVTTGGSKFKTKHDVLRFHLWSYFPLHSAEEIPHCNILHVKISS